MFSVGLLYSTRDFLRLITDSGITPEQFQFFFKSFKYSTADKILKVSFKCGWSKLNKEGNIELTDRGKEISKFDYKMALLLQMEDLILNFNPTWASILIKGRTVAKNYLPSDALQCFQECGLFDQLTDEIIQVWDKLSIAYRNYSQKQMLEIGRAGEKLSYDYETLRTEQPPLWQAIESNIAGYDLLSIVDKQNIQKLKIEVKSTTSNIDYARIHISKNEWNTAIASFNYIFHLWHLGAAPKLFRVSIEEFSKHIPSENGQGEWESIEIPFKTLILDEKTHIY